MRLDGQLPLDQRVCRVRPRRHDIHPVPDLVEEVDAELAPTGDQIRRTSPRC
jgi:hypothetical protein